MITRTEIEYFLALEVHGSFTSAAQALGISQPALTTAIRKLEFKLGLHLFRRTSSGAELTTSGDTILPAIQRARDSFRTVELSAGLIGDARLGVLRVACRPVLAREPVAKLIGEVHRRRPELDIELQNLGLGVSPFDMVRAGLADVCVTTADDNLDGFEVERLGDIELVAIVPPDAVLPDHPTVDDLIPIGLLSMSGFGVINRALARLVGTQAVAESVTLRSDYHGLLVRLALQGRGVHFVTERTGAHYQARGARVVAPADRPVVSIVATFLKDDCPPSARLFLDVSREQFAKGLGT